MSWEGILTAFRMPALDGKIKVKKCFIYRYSLKGGTTGGTGGTKSKIAISISIIIN